MSLVKKVFLTVGVFLLGIPSGSAFAQDEPGGPPSPEPKPADSGPIDLPNPLNADSIAGILDKIINFLLVVAVPVAIIMAVYAGFLFITGGASEEKVKTARKTLLYVVIGVAVLILSKGLVNLVESFLKT